MAGLSVARISSRRQPLERGGHWIDRLLGASPYSAPFTRLG